MIYIAKRIMLTKKVDKNMDDFPVYEDIVICFSDNIDDAKEIINNSSIEEANIVSDGLKIGDDFAKQYFKGVSEIYQPIDIDNLNDIISIEGYKKYKNSVIEIDYNDFLFEKESEVDKLANSKPCLLLYGDSDIDDDEYYSEYKSMESKKIELKKTNYVEQKIKLKKKELSERLERLNLFTKNELSEILNLDCFE